MVGHGSGEFPAGRSRSRQYPESGVPAPFLGRVGAWDRSRLALGVMRRCADGRGPPTRRPMPGARLRTREAVAAGHRGQAGMYVHRAAGRDHPPTAAGACSAAWSAGCSKRSAPRPPVHRSACPSAGAALGRVRGPRVAGGHESGSRGHSPRWLSPLRWLPGSTRNASAAPRASMVWRPMPAPSTAPRNT